MVCLLPPTNEKKKTIFIYVFKRYMFDLPTNEKNADLDVLEDFKIFNFWDPHLWYLNLSDSDLGTFLGKSLKC